MQAVMERRGAATPVRRDVREGLMRGLGRSQTHAVVDLGETEVSCYILRAEGLQRRDRTLRPAGEGHVQSRGIRGGAVVDVAAASRAIAHAVQMAEADAKVQVHGVCVVTACGQLTSHRAGASLVIGGRPVTISDRERVVGEALDSLGLVGRRIIHAQPVDWSVDAQRHVREPVGMVGRAVALDLLAVSINEGVYQTIGRCVEGAHLEFEGVVAAPYASALAALETDEMKQGSICIDMGGGSTSVAVFSGGALIYVDCLGVGGSHVTKDVAEGLTTTLAGAERIKTIDGSAIASSNEDRETVVAPRRGGGPEVDPLIVPRSMLKGIIAPRVEETLEIIKARLRKAGVLERGANVVLVGGASQITGAREVAIRIFDRHVRLGTPTRAPDVAVKTSAPAYCAAIGALHRHAYGPRDLGRGQASGRRRPRVPLDPNANVMVKAAVWLWENL